MSPQPIDPLLARTRIEPTGAPGSSAASGAGTGSDFAQVLEALQRIRIDGERGDPVGDFDRAVGQADDLHRSAMEFKQRLEAAFQQAMSKP